MKPSQIFNRRLQILNLLCSFLVAQEVSPDAKIFKRKLYNDLVFKTFFLSRLGTTLRSMRLTVLNQFIIEEENIHCCQNFNRPPPKQFNPPNRVLPLNFNRPNFSTQ